MKKDGRHPEYRQVLFIDTSTGFEFVTGSSVATKETETRDGVEYPCVRVAISSTSHPVYTGSAQFVDTEGRVDKFNRRFGKKKAS